MLLPYEICLRGNPETVPKRFMFGIRLRWGRIASLT
jgi:hypothetical protein